MFIDNNSHIAMWLTMMEGQKSLTLYWRSFSRWGRERFTFTFAYKGSQQSVYDNFKPVTPQITQDTQRTIFDAPLMLIFKMGHEGYCNLFCLQKRPKTLLWLTATYRWGENPGCMTKNHWRSVDAYFQDEVGSVLL